MFNARIEIVPIFEAITGWIINQTASISDVIPDTFTTSTDQSPLYNDPHATLNNIITRKKVQSEPLIKETSRCLLIEINHIIVTIHRDHKLATGAVSIRCRITIWGGRRDEAARILEPRVSILGDKATMLINGRCLPAIAIPHHIPRIDTLILLIGGWQYEAERRGSPQGQRSCSSSSRGWQCEAEERGSPRGQRSCSLSSRGRQCEAERRGSPRARDPAHRPPEAGSVRRSGEEAPGARDPAHRPPEAGRVRRRGEEAPRARDPAHCPPEAGSVRRSCEETPRARDPAHRPPEASSVRRSGEEAPRARDPAHCSPEAGSVRRSGEEALGARDPAHCPPEDDSVRRSGEEAPGARDPAYCPPRRDRPGTSVFVVPFILPCFIFRSIASLLCHLQVKFLYDIWFSQADDPERDDIAYQCQRHYKKEARAQYQRQRMAGAAFGVSTLPVVEPLGRPVPNTEYSLHVSLYPRITA
ncbi:hypothetical protein J6590_003199 [Homalodisca vitripennis]|nr:hypothetical protein J6590_003199 [Homalodisca vitripennis]